MSLLLMSSGRWDSWYTNAYCNRMPETLSAMKTPFTRRDFLQYSSKATAALTVGGYLGHGQALAAGASDRIKIGQIGVAHSHAEGKLRAYRGSSDFEVVGIVERDPQLRQEAMQKETYQGLKWMTQEELLNQAGLQAVAVETDIPELLPTAEACVAAGMHVHLDKPPGESLPQFERLLQDVEQRGLTLQMGYMYRYNPAVLLLHEFLQEGWLGDVFEINAVMSKEVGNSKRRRWARFAGGTMFELGCHLVDLVVGVLGRPESVTAFNQHAGQQDDTLLDNMLAVCTYPRALATIKSSALEVEGFDRRQFGVCGTKGTFHIQPLDRPAVRLALTQPRGNYSAEYQTIEMPAFERYVADARDLAQIIRGEKGADWTTAHDLAVQATLLQACGLA